MQCLYCKKKLGLFASKKKPFCSDLHEVAYQDELAGLALRRVMDPLFTDPVQKAPLQMPPRPPSPPVQEEKRAESLAQPVAAPQLPGTQQPRVKPVASPIIAPPVTAAPLPESREPESEVSRFHPIGAPPPWGPFVPQIRMEPIPFDLASDLAVNDASLRFESSAGELIQLPEKLGELIDDGQVDDDQEDFAEHAAFYQIHPALEQEKPDPIEDPASSLLPEGYVAWPLSFGTAPHTGPLTDHELRIAAEPAAIEPEPEPEPEPDPAPLAGLQSLATLRLNPVEGGRQLVMLQASGLDLPQPGCRCPLADIAIDTGRLSEGEESFPRPWSAVLPDPPAPIELAEHASADQAGLGLPQRPVSPPSAAFAGVATGELSADVELIPRPWSAALPEPSAPIEPAEHVPPGLGSPKRAVPPLVAAFSGIATGGVGQGVDSISGPWSEVLAQRPEEMVLAAQLKPGLLPAQLSTQPATVLPAAAFAGVANGMPGGGVESIAGQSIVGAWSEVLAQRPEQVDLAAQLEPGLLSAQQATMLPSAALTNIANGRVGAGVESIVESMAGPWRAASPKPPEPVHLPAQLNPRILLTEQSGTLPSATFAGIATGKPGGEAESIAGPWGVQSPEPIESAAQLAPGPLSAEQAAMLPLATFRDIANGSLGEGVEFTTRLWSAVLPKPPAPVELSAHLAPESLAAEQATLLPIAAFVGMQTGSLGEGVEFTARLWSAVLPKSPAPVELSAHLVPGPVAAEQGTMLPTAVFLGIASGSLGEGVEFIARPWSAVLPKPPAPVDPAVQLEPKVLMAEQTAMFPSAALAVTANGSLAESVELTARRWTAFVQKPSAPIHLAVQLRPGLSPELSPERPVLPTAVFTGSTTVPMRALALLEPQEVRLIAKRKVLTGLRESPAKLRIPRHSFPFNSRLLQPCAQGIAQGKAWMASSLKPAAPPQNGVPQLHSPELRQPVWQETPLFARRLASVWMTPFGWLPQHPPAAQFGSQGAHENPLPDRSPSLPQPNLEGWRELIVPRATPLEMAGNPQADRRHRYRPSGLSGDPTSLQRFRAASHIQIREPEFPWSIPNDLPVAAALLPWRGVRIASETRQGSQGTPVPLRLPLKTPVLSEARAG